MGRVCGDAAEITFRQNHQTTTALMCGIAGIVNLTEREPVGETELRQMLALIRHRGPDEFGIYLDHHVGLGSARLSIIDLSGGQQPISNEDGTLWIVFS